MRSGFQLESSELRVVEHDFEEQQVVSNRGWVEEVIVESGVPLHSARYALRVFAFIGTQRCYLASPRL